MTGKTVHVTKNGIKRALSLLFALLMLCSCASVAGVGSDSTEPTATERVSADRIPASTAAEPEPESSEPITSEILSETVVTEYETSESLPDSDTLPPFDPEPITVDSTAKYKNYKSVSDARIALYDYTDDELLFQNGLTSKIYPASVTKLFTVTYARTILDLDHVITVGDEIKLISGNSSTAGLKIGQRYRFEDILYALLLPSGNDVAYTIAAECGRIISNDSTLSAKKAVSAFITGLNKYLKALGVKKTNILTPDGIASTNHYTCLHDLILISKSVLGDKVLSQVVSTRSKTITDEDGLEHTYYNTNPFLARSETYIGIKTGSTKLAKSCIIVAQEHSDGHIRIAYVFAAENVYVRKAEVEGLLNFGYNMATGGTLPVYTNPPSPPSTPKETTKKQDTSDPAVTTADIPAEPGTDTEDIPVTSGPEDTADDGTDMTDVQSPDTGDGTDAVTSETERDQTEEKPDTADETENDPPSEVTEETEQSERD